MRKQIEQELGPRFNLFGIYVSEEESKRMDERDKWVAKFLRQIDEARDEGFTEGKKEMIFKMFAEGLDDEIISKYSSYSIEEIATIKKMEDFDKWVSEYTKRKEKARKEGIIKGKNEIIFNMFSDGLNDEIISKYSSGYSVEDITAIRKEWLEKNKARVEGLAEGEQKKEKEIIFNMFSKGLDDKMISGFVPGYSVEDIANLREEWQKTNSSEETN